MYKRSGCSPKLGWLYEKKWVRGWGWSFFGWGGVSAEKTTFPETRPKFAPENWIANGQDDPSLPFGAKRTIEFQMLLNSLWLRFMEGVTWRIIPVDVSG